MRLVIFGLSVSSTWGNGHAALWRGPITARAAQVHALSRPPKGQASFLTFPVARAVPADEPYFPLGTRGGWREAFSLLGRQQGKARP